MQIEFAILVQILFIYKHHNGDLNKNRLIKDKPLFRYNYTKGKQIQVYEVLINNDHIQVVKILKRFYNVFFGVCLHGWFIIP